MNFVNNLFTGFQISIKFSILDSNIKNVEDMFVYVSNLAFSNIANAQRKAQKQKTSRNNVFPKRVLFSKMLKSSYSNVQHCIIYIHK